MIESNNTAWKIKCFTWVMFRFHFRGVNHFKMFDEESLLRLSPPDDLHVSHVFDVHHSTNRWRIH